jgi:diguanylate cyclase (GGDEF)-like protein
MGSSAALVETTAWLICIGCLMVMWRMMQTLEDRLPHVVLRAVLLLLALFFAVERLAGVVLGLFLPHPSIQEIVWIQVVSAVTVAGGAAAAFPHIRGVKKTLGLALHEQARFLAAMESSLDDFYIFEGVPDRSGKITDFRFGYINPAAERRLKVSREVLLGKILTEVRPYMLASNLIERYREVVQTGEPLTCEVYIDDERIKATWLNIQVVKLGDGIAVTSRDITESRRMAEHVQYLAHYDQLTGLANRTLFQDRLHQAILRARRYKHRVALFVVDIDHFKQVNDTLGHAAGDKLLIAAGKRLISVIRETDTVARMGGDEFVIVMPDFKSMEDVRHCGLLIAKRASEPIPLDDHDVKITLSVGVCTFPDYADGEDDLFRNADAAMYKVKEGGRNGLYVYGEDAVTRSTSEMGLSEHRR